MKVSAMTDPRPLTRRNLRSGPLVASAALAVVVGLSGLALATVAAVSIVRKGMHRIGMPSSELQRRFFMRRH